MRKFKSKNSEAPATQGSENSEKTKATDAADMEHFLIFCYDKMFPETWFKTTFPTKISFDNGFKSGMWERLHYWKPSIVANAVNDNLIALNKPSAAQLAKDKLAEANAENANLIELNKPSAAQLEKNKQAKAKPSCWTAFRKWYLYHEDMPMDVNIKMLLINEMQFLAHNYPEYGIKIKMVVYLFNIALIIPAEIIISLFAALTFIVKEILSIFVFSPIYFGLIRPLYWLVYKDQLHNQSLHVADIRKIDDVRNNSFKTYLAHGVALPVYRLLVKVGLLPYDLFVGIIRAFIDTGKVLQLRDKYRAEMESGLSKEKPVKEEAGKIRNQSRLVALLKAYGKSASVITTSSKRFLPRFASSSSQEFSRVRDSSSFDENSPMHPKSARISF